MWSREYGGTADENTFDFFCPRLEQYDAKKDELEAAHPSWSEDQIEKTLEPLCKGIHEGDFIITQYLSRPIGEGYIDDRGKIDLASIMLYYSTRNGGEIPMTDRRKKVLILSEGEGGDDFEESEKPSPGDVRVSFTYLIIVLFP